MRGAAALAGALGLLLAGTALGAGLRQGSAWLVHLTVAFAAGFGFVAGLRVSDYRETQGAFVPYALFLGAVLFTAVEAHAVGVGIARGAPPAAAALLLPPVAIAAGALRAAVRRAATPGERR